MAWLRVKLHWGGPCPDEFVGDSMQLLRVGQGDPVSVIKW